MYLFIVSICFPKKSDIGYSPPPPCIRETASPPRRCWASDSFARVFREVSFFWASDGESREVDPQRQLLPSRNGWWDPRAGEKMGVGYQLPPPNVVPLSRMPDFVPPLNVARPVWNVVARFLVQNTQGQLLLLESVWPKLFPLWK